MKSDEILLLVRAGYTRQEIDAMDQAPSAPAEAPAAPVEDQAQPAPAADPVPTAQDPVLTVKQSPAPASAVDASAVLSAIDSLGAKITAAMQAASLSAAMMRTPPENESVEQVVASIINPKE